MSNLEKFVDSLIEEKGFSDLDSLMLSEMKNDLMNRIEDRLNMIIVKNMPDIYVGEFEKMMDSEAKDDDVQKFCAEKIPNLESLVAVELANFRDIYLGKQ